MRIKVEQMRKSADASMSGVRQKITDASRQKDLILSLTKLRTTRQHNYNQSRGQTIFLYEWFWSFFTCRICGAHRAESWGLNCSILLLFLVLTTESPSSPLLRACKVINFSTPVKIFQEKQRYLYWDTLKSLVFTTLITPQVRSKRWKVASSLRYFNCLSDCVAIAHLYLPTTVKELMSYMWVPLIYVLQTVAVISNYIP